MKFINLIILVVFAAFQLGHSDQAVTWKKINQERYRDIKNIFLDGNGSMYYSAYNADNNKWSINFTQDFKTYQKMELSEVDSPEKFIKRGESFYAITTNGKVYNYSSENSMWLELPIPANFQTNDILFTDNKMLLLPKFGYVYSSINNGQTWQIMNEVQMYQSFYYGINNGNTIYLLRGNTVFYSSDEGASWNFIFPPSGIDAFVDIEIYNQQLYLVDNNNKFYRLEGDQLVHLGTMNKTVNSFTINSDGSAVVLTSKAVYVSGSSFNAWNKIYDLYEEMPLSVTYILKNRKINTGEKIYFAVPPNDIIVSEDQGLTWKIIKKDVQNVDSKMTATNSLNQVYCLTDKKLFVSEDRAKSWYEVNSPVEDIANINKIKFSVNNALVASIKNQGFKVKFNGETEWTEENQNLTNLNVIDFCIASNGNIFAATSSGIFKANLTELTWELVNTDIIAAKIDLTNDGKVLCYSGRIVTVMEHNGSIINTYNLESFFDSDITDIEHSTSGFWISTLENGFYLYNPDISPSPKKITKGILSDNINSLVFQQGIIWAIDDLQNIYISDNTQDFFQINNISGAELVQISSLDKTYDSKLIASVKDMGLFIADDVNLDNFNTQYVWINNQGHFEHNFQSDRYRFAKYSEDGKSIFTVGDKNNISYIKQYDTKTGSLTKELPVSYIQTNEGCTGFNYLASSASINEEGMFFPISYYNCSAAVVDSIRLYNFSQGVIKKIVSPLKGSDTNNTKIELYPSYSLIIKPNKMLSAISVNYAKGIPPVEPTELYDESYCMVFNTNSGDTIKSMTLTPFSNGKTGRITSLTGEVTNSNSSIAAVAKSIKFFNTQERFSDIDIIDTELNLVRYNISVDSNKSVSKVLLSKDLSFIAAQLGRNIYDSEGALEDNYGEIQKIDLKTKQITHTSINFKAVDMQFSSDSNSITAIGYYTNSLSVSKGIIYIIDINTFNYIDSVEIDKEHIGSMALNGNSEFIAVTGRDGRLRLYKNPMANSVLKAAFTSDVQNINSGETVAFYDLSTNSPQTYQWDFGDGETSNVAEPQHKYTKSGYYTVKLTVGKNGNTNSMIRNNYISVYDKFNLSFSASKVDGFKPLKVDFINNSAGDAESWYWDFGDGTTSTLKNPSKTYLNTGKYTVKLFAKNKAEEDSLIKAEFINVDNPPNSYTVDFTSDKIAGELPLSVTFTPITNPSSTDFVWDFGDNNRSSVANPTHSFEDYGSYSISLKASKEGYGNTIRKVGYISVLRSPIINPIIDNEFEETLFYGNQVGLTAVETEQNHFFIDYSGDTIKAKSSGILSLDIGNNQKYIIPTALNGNDPSPRFITYNGQNNLFLLTNVIIDSKSSIKVISYNKNGSLADEYSFFRPLRNLTPLNMINDGQANIMAIFNDLGTIKLIKLDINNQFLFEKDFFEGKAAKNAFVKMISRENDYLVFYKNSINENPSVLKISKDGDSLANYELYNDKNYWISDFDFDSDGNCYVSGNYKFSPELSSLHSFVIKYNSEFEKIWEQKYEGIYTINAVKSFTDKWGNKYAFAAGSANNKLAFFVITSNGSPNSFYQYNNRPGLINSMITTKDNSIFAVGSMYNNAGRNNLYAIKISGENTFSSVEDSDKPYKELISRPNPVTNSVYLKFSNESDNIKATLKISNISGEELMIKDIPVIFGNNEIKIDLDSSEYPSGVYIVEIQCGTEKYYSKIVKN